METIKCELCGLECRTQITASHLRKAHGITTKQYKQMGYQTLTPSRLRQIQNTSVANGKEHGCRGRFGADHHNWKGGHVNASGYRIISRVGHGHLYEHRVVAQQMIGRPLEKDEVVHHKDGNRLNNSPDNLVVMKRKEHDKMKEGARAFHHTNQDCEDAAKALFALGWSKSKIARGLRVHHKTLEAWINR